MLFRSISITNSTTSVALTAASNSIAAGHQYYITVTTIANNYGPGGSYGNTSTSGAYETTLNGDVIFVTVQAVTYYSFAFVFTVIGYTSGTFTVYNASNGNTPVSGATGINFSQYNTYPLNAASNGITPYTSYYIIVTANANNYGPGGSYGGLSIQSAGVFTPDYNYLSIVATPIDYRYGTVSVTWTYDTSILSNGIPVLSSNTPATLYARPDENWDYSIHIGATMNITLGQSQPVTFTVFPNSTFGPGYSQFAHTIIKVFAANNSVSHDIFAYSDRIIILQT